MYKLLFPFKFLNIKKSLEIILLAWQFAWKCPLYGIFKAVLAVKTSLASQHRYIQGSYPKQIFDVLQNRTILLWHTTNSHNVSPSLFSCFRELENSQKYFLHICLLLLHSKILGRLVSNSLSVSSHQCQNHVHSCDDLSVSSHLEGFRLKLRLAESSVLYLVFISCLKLSLNQTFQYLV